MKNLWFVLAVISLSVPAFTAPSFESARAGLEPSFQSLSAFKPVFKRGAMGECVPGRAVAAAALSQSSDSRSVRVSGEVTLAGTTFIDQNANLAHVALRGTMRLADESGRISSGQVTVFVWADLLVNGASASGVARPNAQVSFYQDGRYAGSSQVSGSFFVSGWLDTARYPFPRRNGWMEVRGSGRMYGCLLARD